MKYAKVENPHKKSSPVVRIDPISGEIVGFTSVYAGAKAAGFTKESDILAHRHKISLCCETKTEDPFGFHWRHGTMFIGIEDDATEGTSLVGSIVNGFLVKSNTHMRLPSGDGVYECECVECGAPRLVTHTALKTGAVKKCACVENLAILDQASMTSSPDLAESVRARLLSQKPQGEERKPWSILDRDGMNGRKRVRQYTLEGEFVAEHASVVDAYAAVNPDKAETLPRRKLQELSSCIASCCRGGVRKSQGFVWKYADDENREAEPSVEPVAETAAVPPTETTVETVVDEDEGLPTTCTDIKSGWVYEFESVKKACAEIAEKLDRFVDPKYVESLCEKGGGAAYGMFWEYLK